MPYESQDQQGGGDVSLPHTQAAPTISLVVPCYAANRIPDLIRLFQSITHQSTPLDELVVVVQQSGHVRDWVGSNLPAASVRTAHLVYLETVPQVSRARNAGVEASNGDIIAFVDDDAVLGDDWVAMTRQFYRSNTQAVGVAGAILPLWDSPSMEWFPVELYWMVSCTYWTSTIPVAVRNGYGANMSFRREAFADGRRFNEATGISGWGDRGWQGMGGEEPEFSLRVTAETGRPILYVPAIRAWHRIGSHRLRLRSLLRRAFWEGRFKAWMSSTHGSASLETEFFLLRDIVSSAFGRLRLLIRLPMTAMRQQSIVTFVILVVAIGYLDGRLRRRTPHASTATRGVIQ